MSDNRSLYQCSQARVLGQTIRCAKRHALLPVTTEGRIGVERLARGSPLVLKACQDCPDFDCLGDPVALEDRGWSEMGSPEE